MVMKMALMITAKDRPQYLRQTLTSWALADGVNSLLSDVVIALGRGPREIDQRATIREICPGARIWLDSDKAAMANGMHRAIAECANRVFGALKPDFLIFGEEDVIVSDDILRYMRWAAHEFQDDSRVLCVLGHNVGGTGWGDLKPPQDADADQEQVRLLPYFNPWIWGCWADRWENTIAPDWDADCNKGGPTTSGYDWWIQTHTIPEGKFVCVVPDAARSQTIGRESGWASSEYSWSFSQAQSFRDHRNAVQYRLVS